MSSIDTSSKALWKLADYLDTYEPFLLDVANILRAVAQEKAQADHRKASACLRRQPLCIPMTPGPAPVWHLVPKNTASRFLTL